MSQDIRDGIIATARALGISPIDLATAISYETAGTFDPVKKGPVTRWGQHQGLIQFGEPQAKQYGVNWDNPVASQLGENGAVANYLRATGVKPGMGLLDVYSAINAGGVGRYNRSDANNGGAPGSVADKVNNQMAGHREKALALLGGGATDSTPKPVLGAIAPSVATNSTVPIPEAVQKAAAGISPSANGLANVFGMMAMADNKPQFAPVQIQGPSPQQANALSSLIQSLRQRVV